MKMRINGRTYEPASPVELSLRDLIALERVTTELGMPVNLGILEERQAEIEAIKAPTKLERNRLLGRQPWAQMLFAVNVFAARRKAGDDVTFDDCLDLSPLDVDWILEPEDEAEPDPTVPPRRPKASAAVVKRPADRAKKASKKASTRASS